MPDSQRLGALLVRAGVIDEGQLDAALQVQQRTGKRLGQVLVASGGLSEDRLVSVLAAQLGVERWGPGSEPPSPELASLIPAELALEARALPVAQADEVLEVAAVDPLDPRAARVLRSLTERSFTVRWRLATESQLSAALEAAYGRAQGAGGGFAVIRGRPESVRVVEGVRPSPGRTGGTLLADDAVLEISDAPIAPMRLEEVRQLHGTAESRPEPARAPSPVGSPTPSIEETPREGVALARLAIRRASSPFREVVPSDVRSRDPRESGGISPDLRRTVEGLRAVDPAQLIGEPLVSEPQLPSAAMLHSTVDFPIEPIEPIDQVDLQLPGTDPGNVPELDLGDDTTEMDATSEDIIELETEVPGPALAPPPPPEQTTDTLTTNLEEADERASRVFAMLVRFAAGEELPDGARWEVLQTLASVLLEKGLIGESDVASALSKR